MIESILTSVKKPLSLAEDYEAFDEDIIIHINSVFSVLSQLGIGPTTGFSIEDSDQTWEEYITDDVELLNMVKSYMYLKVRMLFDPPTNSFTIEAFNKQITEYEYRLNLVREQKIIEDAGYPDVAIA